MRALALALALAARGAQQRSDRAPVSDGPYSAWQLSARARVCGDAQRWAAAVRGSAGVQDVPANAEFVRGLLWSDPMDELLMRENPGVHTRSSPVQSSSLALH